jgi:hypothetical protein
MLYASMMSATAFAGIVSDFIGTTLMAVLQITATNFDNLWLLLLICDAATLLPLCFLWLVPSKENIDNGLFYGSSEQQAQQQQGDDDHAVPLECTPKHSSAHANL